MAEPPLSSIVINDVPDTIYAGTTLSVRISGVDESGAVHARYPGNVYVRGNLSYGKLAVDGERLYVAGQDRLTRFELGDPGSATAIYDANQVFDVEILSNGNLLVASAYRVAEISNSPRPSARTPGTATAVWP